MVKHSSLHGVSRASGSWSAWTEAECRPGALIENALAELSDISLKREVRENNYVFAAFPRFLYKMGRNQDGAG